MTSTTTPAHVRATPGPSTPEARDPHHARRWLSLAVLGLAQLMVVLDATIVNIALPTVQMDLGFTDSDRQWVITAYALAFGSLLLLGGRIADVVGRKTTFIVGLIGFAAASALGGIANGFALLIIARALQGVFGALLAPAALSLLTTTFTDPAERGKAFGIYGAIAGSGGAIGLLLGGVLTEYASWRWCLYVNVPIAFVAVLGGLALLSQNRPAVRPKLDIPGVITVSAGLFALVYGFSNVETYGWSDPMSWGFLVAAGVFLAIFWWLQTVVAHPLFPPRILLHRDRAGSYLAVFVIGAGMFGVFLFLTYYLQIILQYSPIRTGLAFMPMAMAIMLSATTATAALLPRIGSRPLVVLGLLIAAACMVWMTWLDADSSYVSHVLPPLVIAGIGFGLVMAPAMNGATLGVEPSDAGVASATVNTSQQVGGSMGTALLNTLAAQAASDYLVGRTPTPEVVTQSLLHSYDVAFLWSAGIFAVGALLCGLLLRSGVPRREETSEPALIH